MDYFFFEDIKAFLSNVSAFMYTFCKISKFVKVRRCLGIVMSNHITLTEKKGNPSEYSEATANIPIMQM